MVGDGRLGQAERFGQLADARLAAFVRGDHGDQPQPGRVGQGLEQPGEVGGLAGGDRFAQQGRAAHISQREGRPVLDVGSGDGHLTSMR